ncbi:Hsp70 family protein [Herbidospora daliensis]|uniref:Hsp70 family protein n=1 Tax=Herbidospora daliensis TaxID=295585 RepID=UPI0018DD513B|nr:Hsp70 family protein [Herbidospora daliensis]
MRQAILAVDFGTCSSSAALVGPGRVELVKEPASGLWSWPSVVCLAGDTLLVGTLADNRKTIVAPDRFRDEFKRELRSDARIDLGGRVVTASELVMTMIRALKGEAERISGGPVERAVLTVPASYGEGDPRRALMVRAAEGAGFGLVELLAEPVAAALAPLAGAPPVPGDLLLVYDFGGGTFDCALVRVGEQGVHEILGHASLDDCGGGDVDALLYHELVAQLPSGPPPGHRHQVLVRDLAKRVKHQLSDVSPGEAIFEPAGTLLSLTAGRLAELVVPVLDRTTTCCLDLLRRCGVAPEQVTSVVMVGGSTRMPVITDVVIRAFGRPLRHTRDPDLAVIQGAAVWAGLAHTRTSAASPPAAGEVPLRWEIPGRWGVLQKWRVAEGDLVEAGGLLGSVRLPDGALHDLASGGEGPMTVQALHYDAGTAVTSDDWLVTARPRPAEPVSPPGRVRHTIQATDEVSHLELVEVDGRLVVVTSENEHVVIRDAETGRRLRDLPVESGVTALAVLPGDGEPVVVTGDDDDYVTTWHASTGEKLDEVDYGATITALAVSLGAGGRHLAVGNADGELRVEAVTGGALSCPAPLFEVSERIRSLAFLDDRVAVATGDDVSTIDPDDPEEPDQYDYDEDDDLDVVSVAAAGLDGRPLLAVAGDDDRLVLRFPLEDRHYAYLDCDGDQRAVAFGTLQGAMVLVSGGDDGRLRVWDVRQRRVLHLFEDHNDWINAVAIATWNGRTFVASGGDGQLIQIYELD